jgi:hypothetical protein
VIVLGVGHDSLEPFILGRRNSRVENLFVIRRRLRSGFEERCQVQPVNEQPICSRHDRAYERATREFVYQARPYGIALVGRHEIVSRIDKQENGIWLDVQRHVADTIVVAARIGGGDGEIDCLNAVLSGKSLFHSRRNR